MATISNIINTIFTSTGASDVAGEAERVSRSQTRLGQASASAGRQFAAQASGLGGLVGAYAGAAATVFALQAAFTALANAARASQTFEGLNTLASNIGANGTQLLSSVRELTNNQLTLSEAASQINLSLSAGFNTSQIEGLSEVALKASRALGRDLTDSMTRVVRGSAKMETELLDELGIYTKIEPATRAYATAIGKSVGDLSEFERRQAFANAVIAEGQRKFASINTTIPTTAETIEAFGVKIQDLTMKLGILLAEALAPLANFLTNNAAAAFAALGIAISLAAGKGIQVLSAGLQSINTAIVNAGLGAENFVRKITGIQGAATTASNAIKTLTADTLRLNDAEKARIASIQTAAASRNLSKSEIKESNALIRKSITVLNAERAAEETRRNTAMASLNASRANVDAKRADFEAARNNLRTLQQQGATTAALTAAQGQLASAQGRLGAATAAFNNVQGANVATVTASRTAILGLNADVARLNATLLSTVPAAQGARVAIAGFLAASARVVSNVAGGFGALFTGIVGAASKLFFVTSIVTLIGSSFANAIGKGEEFQALLNKLGSVVSSIFTDDSAKRAKSAIQGITAANLSELEKTNSELRNIDSFTFKTKVLGFEVDVTKTKEQLASEVTTLLTDASNGLEKTKTEALTSGKAIGSAIGGNLLGGLLTLIPGIGPLLSLTLGRAIGTAIGYAAGSIWDYFSDVPDIPPELATKIKAQFADSLSGLDEGVQDKLVQVLGTLEQRYGAAARFDPAARAALKTQQQLVLEGGKYLNDIEAVSELMIATGQTADKIVKNFKFDDSERQISYISQAFTELAGREFTFNFIDLQDEQLQKLINADYKIDIPVTLTTDVDTVLVDDAINTLTGSYLENQNITQALADTEKNLLSVYPARAQEIEQLITTIDSLSESEKIALAGGFAFGTLKKPIEEAVGAYNAYQQSSIRALEVQRQLSDSLGDGTATLESFTQGLANSKNAVIEAERGYASVDKEIAILEQRLVELQKVNPELAAGLEDVIYQLRQGQELTSANLAEQKNITKEYAAQEAILKNQITLSSFFKSFSKEAKNPLTLELELITAGSENKLAAQVGYLQQFVTASKTEIEAYNKLKNQLSPLSLTDSEEQEILLSSIADGEALAQKLTDSQKSIEATFSGGVLTVTTNVGNRALEETASLDLLKDNVGSVASVSLQAAEAINQLVRQAAENLPQFIDEKLGQLKQTIESADAEIRKIAQDEIVFKIKFETDLEQVYRDIELIKQESLIEQIQLDIDLSKAKVDSKSITPEEGASQETALRQQLLQEEANLLKQQYDNEFLAIEARREIMIAESESRVQSIAAEADLQVKKILADKDYVTGVAGMYDAAIAGLNESADRQVQGIVDAANSASDSWAKTLQSGANAINSAIVSGLNKSTTFSNAVQGGSAEAPNLAEATSNRVTEAAQNFAVDSMGAIRKIRVEQKALTDAELAARQRASDLMDAEQEKALANYEARILANEKLTEIEKENAISRAREAAEAGGKDKDRELTALEERLKALFNAIKGNIENTLMSLNNLVFYGEGSFKEIMGGFFKSVQQDFFKTTVAEPVSDFLTTSLFSALGVEGAALKKGTDGLSYQGNSLLVKVTNAFDFMNPASAVTNPEDPTGKTKGIFGNFFDQITSLFSNIFGQNGFVSNLFKGLMGEGGILSGLFSGIGGFFTSLLGFSQGGLVHLAAGGAAASATLNRDRIPAMLEPGEFVIRKQSAERIGVPALQAMNATGEAGGGNGNVFVNVTNEGSPKQAEASSPKFDGEKYVIDIVMRDIANNGPIRRSLRGRGGL